MTATLADAVGLGDAVSAATRHLGEAERTRIWCVTSGTDLNRFRRIEFDGWLVGWGEGLSGGSNGPRSRTEVTLFLTTDGRIITSVNLTPGATFQIIGSPPDCWATFLGDHGSLGGVASWLESVRAYVGDDGMDEEAGADALARAAGLVERIGRSGRVAPAVDASPVVARAPRCRARRGD